MSIYRRGTTLYVSVTYGNLRVRRSARAHTKAEAKACEARILVQLQQGVPPDQIVAYPHDPLPAERKRKWTLKDAFDRALRESWAHMKSVNSYHKPVGGSMVRQLGADRPLSDLEAEDLINLRARTVTGDIKPATFNRYMQILSTLINLSREWEKPVPKLKPLKYRLPENERFRIVSAEEEPRLVRAAASVSDEAHDWIVCSLDIGWRRSEGVRVRPRDVSLQDRYVTLWDGKSGSRGVPLTHRAKASLKRQMKRAMQEGDLTLWTWDKDQCVKLWARIKADAGVTDPDLTAHCMRHTTATRLLSHGHDIHVVATWLGHSNLRTTQQYAKVLGHTLNAARDSLEGG